MSITLFQYAKRKKTGPLSLFICTKHLIKCLLYNFPIHNINKGMLILVLAALYSI